jgi:hypothetical protein
MTHRRRLMFDLFPERENRFAERARRFSSDAAIALKRRSPVR